MRSHYCGHVNRAAIGRTVTVAGWVHRRRDHGGVIFIDLRDREGLLQVVFDPDRAEIFAEAERLRSEFVLTVEGVVRARPDGTVNPNLASGEVEVLASKLTVLAKSKTPPFHHDEPVSEELRLRYRYLDLRREPMLRNLRLRHSVTRALRKFMDEHGFVDVETPILTKTTPEGARDYLVPSRTQQGSFFALPQSPQLMKQLLMMSGLDRYYQIVKCFRDEDLRADRQPEFTQLDIETSFMSEEDILGLMEELLRETFKSVLGVELPKPFQRMTYADALRRYGSDKPDLRNPLELVEVADLFRGVEFKVFAGPAADPKSRIAALKLPKGGELTRKEIDDYTALVGRHGAKGLAYIKVNERAKGRDGLQSPILKFLPDAAIDGVLERVGAHDGDLVFFGADKTGVVNESLNALRSRSAATASSCKANGRRSGSSTFRCSKPCRAAVGRRCTTRSRRRATRRRPPARGTGRGDRARLRHRAERLRGRRRLRPYPRSRAPVDDVRLARHRERGGRAQVRLLADGARLSARRRTAASRSASTGS